MDSGDGSPGRDVHGTSVVMYARIPAELKYLVNRYRSARKMPSYNYAIQHLLESHPEIAELAAELYTESQVRAGQTESGYT